MELGLSATKLGSGRAKAGDKISYEVGCRILKHIGEKVSLGMIEIIVYLFILNCRKKFFILKYLDEPWLEVYHNNVDFDVNHSANISNSLIISDEPVKTESLIIKIIDFE